MHSVRFLKKVAGEMGLNMGSFVRCVEDHEERGDVLGQRQGGEDLWVTGTPTFFINGERYVGALPLEKIRALVAESRGI
jgi:protein-disulfide isomerase